MSKAEKRFDAVAMMRAGRDKISAEIDGMTLEEELTWLASQEVNDPFLERLRDRAAQQDDDPARTRPLRRTNGRSGHGHAPVTGNQGR